MSVRIKIKSARVYRVIIPLEQPFVLAYKNVSEVENVVLRLESEDGVAGWGCASPESRVTGETVADTVESLTGNLIPALMNAPELSLPLLLNMLEHAAPGAHAACAAADVALHDMAARRAGVCLLNFLGGPVRKSIPTCMTISISDVGKTLDDARRFAGLGFRFLKIKCGLDPEMDIARVRAIRAALPDLTLHLDANQGYAEDQALHVVHALKGDIIFLEQPGPKEDRDLFNVLCAESPVPIMADEPVLTPGDALDMFRRGVPYICVKLMKSGGVAAAVRLCELAGSLGRGVMIGCMEELPVSMAAAACVALSQPAVRYADLDGHLDMIQDFAHGGIFVNNGVAAVSDALGSGAQVNEETLKPFLIFES
jgi:L-alanine-DL-glutamate epimerase-like enolase superfamily enzyme